ncbi:Na+/H+ antiporter subunit E, partial [Nocardioides sp.]|uniref:Na+/H+ antiporter subunit E n=1 Tax=Nocardioides sp. TaxID=35761 RepID=UPI002732D1A4
MSPLKRTRSVQPVPVVWLTLVWVLLWRDITFVNVVSGVVVAALVCFVFPLPPLRTRLRVRPIALAALVARFLHEVVLASAQVVRITLTPGRVQNAIIEVPLRTPSD